MLTAGAVALAAPPQAAQAQACSAGSGGTILTPQPIYVGETVTEEIELRNTSAAAVMTIDNYSHKLECLDDGVLPILLELCVPGNAKDFIQVVSTDCTDGPPFFNPVNFNCVQNGNDLDCQLSPATVLAPQADCAVTIDFLISNPPGADVSPDRIEQATGFEGTCDNGLDGSARGSVAIPIALCEVQMDRQVSCDGVNFVDVRDVDDPDNADTLSCSTSDPSQVTVRHVIRNAGNQDLLGCVLTDDNPLLGASQVVGDILVGDPDVVIETSGVCADIVDAEPNKAFVDCSCDNGLDPDVPTSDDDFAGFTCTPVLVPATSPWGTALLALMLLAALSLWTVWKEPARA